MMTAYILIVMSVVSLTLWAVVSFNSVIRRQEQVVHAWQVVDDAFRRRNSVIKEAIELWVKYVDEALPPSAEHIRELIVKEGLQDWSSVPKRTEVQRSIMYAFQQFKETAQKNAVLNSLPEFKQTEEYFSFIHTEVLRSIKAFNTTVMSYNDLLVTFPNDIMARRLGYNIASTCRVETV